MKIPKWLKHQLSDAGLESIRGAVLEAERRTSGEIVPMIVHRSAHRGHVFWLILFSTFALLALVVQTLAVDPKTMMILEVANIVVSILAALMFAKFDWTHRLCTSREDREAAALLRAQLEFYELNLKQTRARTGILLFVSLAEHQAVVLADEGIAKLLPQETWQEVVDTLLGGVRRKDFAGGMVAAIKMCGDLLAQKFPRDPADHDELPNRLFIEE